MKPFRKNVAIAIDGGGIKGIMVTRALSMLEKELGKPVNQIFQMAAGTSTGSIISAGIASGLTAAEMDNLYLTLGETIFRKSWRTALFPLTRYRYPSQPLQSALQNVIGDRKMSDFWTGAPKIDVVITTFDLVTNHTRFIKPWKPEFADWPVVQAVMASSTVPTYFPIVAGRYVDGGVGAYANPCYLAAFEAQFCLNWDPSETTLISFGTGRDPHYMAPGQADSYYPWQWISPVLGAFLQSSDDLQVQVVSTFFNQLDFRRFNVDQLGSIGMDEVSRIQELIAYGEKMGQKMLNDEVESIPDFKTVESLNT